MRDIENKRQWHREWRRKRRADWIQAHGPCARCGSWEQLEADHIDRTEKKIKANNLWSMSDDNPIKIAELAKLQVLCHDCHKAKTISESSKPLVHGTVHGYKRGRCKCAECRAAWSAYENSRKHRQTRTFPRTAEAIG